MHLAGYESESCNFGVAIVQQATLIDLWTPAGVLLGFQITLFYWRLEREVSVGDAGRITWLAPADYLGIVGTIVFVLGVFLLPLAGFAGPRTAGAALGLGALLFVGHFLGLCGHYEVFDATKPRSFAYFPRQEKIIVALAALAVVSYLVALMLTAPH